MYPQLRTLAPSGAQRRSRTLASDVRRPEERPMKKMIAALLGFAGGLAAHPAAQAAGDKIVYDQCYADAINWEYVCGIYVGDADGSNTIWLTSSGMQPVWAPVGSKIAFVNWGDVYVLDFRDST